MLLTISEKLAQLFDLIKGCWLEIAGAISIPVILGFLLKLILSAIKNKATIKNAVNGAMQEVKNGVSEMKSTIHELQDSTNNKIDEFKIDTQNYIDLKFEELKQRRKSIYNNVINGVEFAEETKAIVQEHIEEKSEEIQKETVKIEEMVKEKIEQIEQSFINSEDIMRG